jgi:thiol-disulfide isomerase/thioredoxin
MSVHFPETHRRYMHYRKKDDFVVIKYGAEWCGPCKAIKPLMKELAEKYPDVYFLDVDVDTEQGDDEDVAMINHFDFENIKSIPHFKFFLEQKLVKEFRGSDKERLKRYVERYSKPKLDRAKLDKVEENKANPDKCDTKVENSVKKDKVTKDEVTKDEVTKDEVTKDEVTKDEVTKDEVTKDEVTKEENEEKVNEEENEEKVKEEENEEKVNEEENEEKVNEEGNEEENEEEKEVEEIENQPDSESVNSESNSNRSRNRRSWKIGSESKRSNK